MRIIVIVLTFKGLTSCLSTPAWCLRKTNVRYIDRRKTLVLRTYDTLCWNRACYSILQIWSHRIMSSGYFSLSFIFLFNHVFFLFLSEEQRLASRTEWMSINYVKHLRNWILGNVEEVKKKLILFIVTFLWRYEPRASGGFHESLSFLCIRVIVIVKGKEIKYFVLVNKGVLCPAPSMLRSVADF